jgi:hypothetical protein
MGALKSTEPVRVMGTPLSYDLNRSTDALVNAVAEKVAQRVLERLGDVMPKERQDGPQLLDRAGIAIALGVSVSTIDRLVAKNCPFIWVLDSRRFEYDAVKAWLKTEGGE